ncbi:MATH domain and coiled-coil domain-containing protein [Trifolium repens]|nr:MATH domain and coiled-coil domain-containing protein [Trifolium repens]
MEHQETKVEIFEKFTWKIENFSHLNATELYSDPIILGGYPWRILLFPKGNDVENSLSIYFEAMQTANMSKGWSRDVKFKLLVFNQLDANITVIRDSTPSAPLFIIGFLSERLRFIHIHIFSRQFGDMKQEESVEKFEKFTWKVENFSKYDPDTDVYSEPFLIGGYPWMIILHKSGHGDLSISLSAVLTSNMSKGWSRLVKVKLFVLDQIDGNRSIIEGDELEFNEIDGLWEESHGQNLGELIDFKGLGQIEKDLVPLLEEVCSHHPSLIECQQNRSRKFKEWAFTALGRVLHFLKTTKVKDMNDLACKNLQNLWEELEAFSFDLTWLEPHVQSALGMRSYMEKVKKVQKLKDNEVALELEIMRLKAKLVTLEVNLYAVRDLLKAEDFERDLDAELGFVKPIAKYAC